MNQRDSLRSLIVSSSLRADLEGLETVTDVAKCRGRVISKMNLTFGVYMRPANCASWERARQTRTSWIRRDALRYTPNICCTNARASTASNIYIYTHYGTVWISCRSVKIYRLRNGERRNHRERDCAPACILPNFIGVLYQCEFDSWTCKNYDSLYEPETWNYSHVGRPPASNLRLSRC